MTATHPKDSIPRRRPGADRASRGDSSIRDDAQLRTGGGRQRNRTKCREVARRDRIDHAFTYEEFGECLRAIDAVYIALPNSMHADYRSEQPGPVSMFCAKNPWRSGLRNVDR